MKRGCKEDVRCKEGVKRVLGGIKVYGGCKVGVRCKEGVRRV